MKVNVSSGRTRNATRTLERPPRQTSVSLEAPNSLKVIPDAARHEMLRRRSGIYGPAQPLAVRSRIWLHHFVLQRVRDDTNVER
jgi:hypothetical protein